VAYLEVYSDSKMHRDLWRLVCMRL
jgi:hypothetical protein